MNDDGFWQTVYLMRLEDHGSVHMAAREANYAYKKYLEAMGVE